MAGQVRIDNEVYTDLQLAFVREYFVDYNATRAYIRAGYVNSTEESAASSASTLLREPKIAKLIRLKLQADLMTKEELVHRLAAIARGADIASYTEAQVDPDTGTTYTFFDLEKFKADGLGFLVKSVTNLRGGSVRFDFYDSLKALELLAKQYAMLIDVLVQVKDDVSQEQDSEARKRRVRELLKAAATRARPPDKDTVIDSTATVVHDKLAESA